MPTIVGRTESVGGLNPGPGVGVGTASIAVDEMKRWIREDDLDGYHVASLTKMSLNC